VALAVTTRNAERSDVEFAFKVTEAAMRSYVEQTWGEWKAGWQREHHVSSFNAEPHRVVLVGEVQAGILVVAEAATHLQVEKLYLLPEFQNQGIGTALLEGVLRQGQAASKPVFLRVLTVNTSAQRFYARHGFRITEFSAVRCVMAAGT
jgi:ribosomal protein S18 acetylase RimI-like enzyme